MTSGLVGHCVDVVQDWQQPLLGNSPVQEGQVGGETLREEGVKGKIQFLLNSTLGKKHPLREEGVKGKI